ncbi:MAG TPA: hypothetical protein PKC43_04530 [Phycisphaerales bacterium]|nr:hypothetical protein [Phycisphaerales bacterium]HMP36694.1 hypothetical protein [Phycisphaerales bacterium]
MQETIPDGTREIDTIARQVTCRACGAMLAFVPGALILRCDHCGGTTPIDPRSDAVEEQDFLAAIAELDEASSTVAVVTYRCRGCGGATDVTSGTAATHCPYCGVHANIIGEPTRVLKPTAILPFALGRSRVESELRRWVESLWFAPGALRRELEKDRHLDGLYLPHWTFDARTTTAYEGWRGDHYTVTVGHGNNRRTETRTRWSPRAGSVRRNFDDVLVPASTSELVRLARRLGGWELARLVAYDERFVAGFLAESYTVDLRAGFEQAKLAMQPVIEGDIRLQIGGHVQRIDWRSTACEAVQFKYVLLPLWVGTFRFRGRSYRFLAHGVTGRISADRPWSVPKILLAVLGAIVAGGALALLATAAAAVR